MKTCFLKKYLPMFYTANILKKFETIKFFMLKIVNRYKINFLVLFY